MKQTPPTLKQLLPYGAMTAIATKLGVSTAAVSYALKNERPSSRIVQEAMRMVQSGSALDTARALAALASAK